ncbi:MAG: alkaline phosphatase family protein [Chloroflexota bacterium]
MQFSNNHHPHANGRVMIIGLDGATFDLIEPWAAAGHLPNMARLLQEGASARLLSTIPAHSGPGWATFATGLLPGKHGVYHFAGPTRDAEYFRPLSGDSIRGRRFWDLAGDHNRTVGIINVPLTFPPRKVNGYMIAGLFAPNGAGAFESRELYEEVYAHCGEYIVNAPVLQNRQAFLDGLLNGMAGGLKVGEYLLDKHPTDLFVIVFRMIDSVMHRYWADMDPDHPLYAELGSSAIPNGVLDGYKLLDEAIGRLLEKSGPDTTLYIMSDHGFRAEYRRFSGNKWLRDNGLLALKGSRASMIGFAEKWAERLRIEMMLKKVGMQVLKLMGGKSRPEGVLFQAVDWTRTKAVFGPTIGLNLNVKGRDAQGIVEPEEYEPLRDRLIKELKAIRDPETGHPVFQEVWRREEVYFGEAVDLAPDLVFEMGEYHTNGKRWSYGMSAGFTEWRDYTTPSRRLAGEHAPDGIFMAYGPHISRGQQFPDFSIADIAPTILYTMGVPVPQEMDGVVRLEVFDPAYVAANPVAYTHVDLLGTAGSSGQALAEGYNSAVAERLRDLGYLE